ncbi:MAG: sigma 54-interacting transcriptional regulator [Desulfosarcina sp.]|nr:sigma 54-interacting transcriptional regulator [Desulfosarcina sp.]MBC2744293.1 sigma 54-interacting transcriptional regulator [Desulfosarcina sp.]MBC2767202.1 sigma 54-interacting transcriptional regulator [Desulfosarcina sp.]
MTGRWYYNTATPIVHIDGSISKLSLCFDITEKKRAEDALLESERRLSTLMNNLPGIVYRCRADESFTMEFASRGSKRLLGFEPEELLEKGPHAYQRIVHPEDRKNMLNLVSETVAMKRPFSFIYRIRAAGGEEKWVWEQGEGVFDDDQLVALEGFISDVTAYKEVELDLRKENLRLRSSISDRYRFGDIIGKSEKMQAVYDMILKAAASDASVIIFGESGSGKELVARAIHRLSDRRVGNFVPVNCGAIPKDLMEREFFGHLKGAFTGANSDKGGFLDFANSGTLFLDEIGEIEQAIQVKLLRVLDGVGYTPLGGIKLKKSDFRVIAATNRDLVKLVKDGRMREDFFYRIRILPIQLPPLRERKEDIPLLIDHFLSKLTKGNEGPRHLPVRVREAMETYSWPGNVRELQNVLHTYITLGKLDLMGQISVTAGEEQGVTDTTFLNGEGLRQRMDALEKKMILGALEAARWHRGRAAEALQLNYKTLQRKMKAHGVK